MIDTYIYLALRRYFKKRIWSRIQLVSAIILISGLIALLVFPVRTVSDSALVATMWVIFAYISIYLPKIIFVIFDLVSHIPNLWKKKRWKPVSAIGAVLAFIVFISLWWGAIVNRVSLDTEEVTITDSNLPEAFDGLRIVQISDMHVGSYGNDTTFISRMVSHINSLHPDIVFFTGDLVNRNTAEAYPFVETLAKLRAPMGVYSILGNHDYGDYTDWPNEQAKIKNRQEMDSVHAKIGWRLLNNSHVKLTKDDDTLVVIGVENIGDPPFNVYGDLKKAYSNVSDNHYKILLSHNPAHWDSDIQDNDTANIALTLSGHTHAMQMRAFGKSPASLRYKHWGGLYTDSLHHNLYVNIGTGVVGYPARLGSAWPEITLITLRKK